ncbi:Trk system potassium transporter TrkA [Halobacterium jilantaiense]|uniref:Trk system potassium uptake protein TrkA n=1 Tax=Halobacterium jilantaiense TaxID=355548 RepID=A0A1I0QN17_9EURY|nr:Trk system potassium transporter TrkA [Halobacterium jilantaiense]SEW28773.1 trk system potassium uptake protein TrkA [Halobacterium jilantaiense]
MRVIIAGAGQVGTRVAAELDADHDVVLIDTDAERIDRLSYDLDVLTVTGDSSAIDTLREAGIEDADILIASTDSDEINILTCATAKALADVTTVARVKDVKYIDTWDQAENVFDVDFMVGTNLLTVAAAAGGTGLSAARNFDVFAGGMVQMAEFEVGADSPLVDQSVREADQFDGLTFAAILRGGTTIVPTGETRIQAGDDVVVVGPPQSVHAFGAELASREPDAKNVLVIGGSDVGYHTARLLEERGLRPHLVAANADRARELAERLSTTTVRNRDPTDRDFLESERMTDVDVVVAALDHDSEENLLAALRAQRRGADRSVAIVDHGEYVDLFEAAGVDVAVNPRRATATEIIEFVRDQDTQNVALLEDNQAQVIEIRIDRDSVLTGRPIRESVGDLPEGVVVGAITRNGSFLVPRGDTVIETGDHAVILADSDVVEETIARL